MNNIPYFTSKYLKAFEKQWEIESINYGRGMKYLLNAVQNVQCASINQALEKNHMKSVHQIWSRYEIFITHGPYFTS